jgi:hypothetical protein
MDDDLVAITARALYRTACKRDPGESDERFRARRPSRFRGTALLAPLAFLKPITRSLKRTNSAPSSGASRARRTREPSSSHV